MEMDRENSSVPHLSDGTAIYSCIITARDNGTIRLSNSKMVCVFCVFYCVYLINVQRQIYSMPINYYCKKMLLMLSLSMKACNLVLEHRVVTTNCTIEMLSTLQ